MGRVSEQQGGAQQPAGAKPLQAGKKATPEDPVHLGGTWILDLC